MRDNQPLYNYLKITVNYGVGGREMKRPKEFSTAGDLAI